MFDGFQNEAYLKMADKVLKEVSKIAAKDAFKVKKWLSIYIFEVCVVRLVLN